MTLYALKEATGTRYVHHDLTTDSRSLGAMARASLVDEPDLLVKQEAEMDLYVELRWVKWEITESDL